MRVLLVLALSASCIAADLGSEAELKKFIDSKNYEDGVAGYTRELATHPADAALLTLLGRLHYSFAKYSEAAAALDQALAQKDAPAAAAWTVTIGDDALRRKQTKDVITTWAAKDRTAARAWVQQQPSLAAPERQELLQTLDPQGRK
jgi:tetratricopeptide (TPR) repeat protein